MSQLPRELPTLIPVPPGAVPAGGARKYTTPMLYDLLGSNGWNGHALEIGAAIIGAESGGDPHARNVNKDGSVDRGLFQINNLAHPDITDACAYNPRCAARAAWRISQQGKDFSPWSSSQSVWSKTIGKPGSLAAASGAQNAGLPDTLPKPLSDLGRIADLLTSTEFWVRLGEAILGAALLLMGLRSLTGEATTPASIARSVAGAVA